MKDATIWNVLRRSWRTMMTPRGRDRPIPIHTGSADAMLLASAMQALKSDDLPSLMQSACRHLRELSGADCTSVILIDPDRGDGACRIAAGDGCPTAVIGMQVVLPLRPDGSLLHSDSERWLADTASIDLPTYTQQDFSIGLWEPIKRNHRTLGWMTAHARDASALAPMSHPVATALADIIGSALIRDRALIKFKKEAIHARALCQELPVLWLCIDGRSGTLLDCNAAINSRLGHRPFTCIGKPAAILFEGQDDAAVKEVLCRPATTEVEVGLPFHLKHRNGSIIPCVGDGILIGEMGASSPDDVRVVWVFHERQAVQWAIQRSPGRKSGASPLDFDWTLECDRERRQKSLQVLNLLRRSLQGLRCLFSEGAIGIH
ncbi:MAG: PAS domain-containing protein, partial [Nitrospira sp.]|nr:PAS domain-containing protein [Nitrospira sp.]